MTALSKGRAPGPENAIIKLVNASKLLDLSSFGLDLLGPAGVVRHPAFATLQDLFQDALLAAPGSRIAAGTDEILRNIIAERVLGLPAEFASTRTSRSKISPRAAAERRKSKAQLRSYGRSSHAGSEAHRQTHCEDSVLQKPGSGGNLALTEASIWWMSGDYPTHARSAGFTRGPNRMVIVDDVYPAE